MPPEPGSESYDVDGPEGPKPAILNEWRFMFLNIGSLPGNPFFVEYNLSEANSKLRADQPITTGGLNALWLLLPIETSPH